jgi:hypothetical protein
MAKATLSPVFDKVTGTYGDLVFREVNGETIWAHKPKQSAETEAVQTAFTERCKRGQDYHNRVKKEPAVLALYEQAAEATGLSVYRLCTSDYHHPPTVDSPQLSEYKGQAGDGILFNARDDFGVVKVIVTISNEDEGTLIEQGMAVPEVEDTSYWMYTATQTVPAGTTVAIRFEAFDRPRGMGSLTATKRIQ